MSANQPGPQGRGRLTGLWRHPDFLKLWAGQTVSVFGSLITRFALPLLAILTLQATPLQVALLGIAEIAPGLLLGLFAGVWVDRLRRRPVLIIADLARAALLCWVPIAAALEALSVQQLYFVASLVSALTVLFDVAYVSYLPSLVSREQLVEGNSKLEASASVSEVAGFGLAGVLVQALTPPFAVLVDALTFVVSACSLALIRAPEPAPIHSEPPVRVLGEIVQGLRRVWGDRLLRAIAAASVTQNFFAHIFVAVLLLFLTRDLGLPPVALGFIFAVGGVSAFVGAIFVERVTHRWGVGRAMLGSFLLSSVSTFFIPLAFGPAPLAVGMLAAEQAFDGTGMAYQINKVSLTQAITPARLQGRVNASMRVMERCAMLLGLLAGGVLGQRIGLRPTVFVGVSGMLLGFPWLYLSPLRTLAVHPPSSEEAGTRTVACW